MITVESLTRRYAGFTAVDNVSFTAQPCRDPVDARPADGLRQPWRHRPADRAVPGERTCCTRSRSSPSPFAGSSILAVTSEWSQCSGLTTFTLVPSRGHVIGAKAIATLLVGLGSMAVAFAVGALGNVAGSALAGVDTVWDISLSMAPQMVLGDLVGMAIGFTLGVVLRNSAAAIVGYFVVSFVMPGILVLLAQVRSWFEDLQPWIDWNETQVVLFDGATNTGKEWAMLGSTTMIWIVIPLVVGLLFLRRSEVK